MDLDDYRSEENSEEPLVNYKGLENSGGSVLQSKFDQVQE
jgi:hypothetical protein